MSGLRLEKFLTEQLYKRVMVGMACAAMVVLSFGVGVLIMRTQPATPQGPQVANGAGVASGIGTPAAAVAVADQVAVQFWSPVAGGCKAVQTGTQFRITGTSLKDGWYNNGVATGLEFPKRDFTAAVVFKAPKFSGPGQHCVYLRANSSFGDHVGILCRLETGQYRVQAWTTPQKFSSTLEAFGDEAGTFHRMKLQYEAATQTATGWVDERRIGSLTAALSGRLNFDLIAATDKAGVEIDLVFDHFTLVMPGVNDPLTPVSEGGDVP